MSIGGSQYADEVLTTALSHADKLQHMHSMAKNKSMKSFEEGNKNVVDAYERLGVSV